jgi:pyruvate dehydrogenase E2 component (dihydrolipoamide acetyltransferase)
MATVVRMPSVLAGATEAAIAHWLVSPGDTVTAGTPVAEIETEKALVEYAAEEGGVIGRLVLGEGDSGEIGDPIAVLVAAGETEADIDAALGVAPASPVLAAPARGLARDERAARAGRRAGLRQPARAQARRGAGH